MAEVEIHLYGKLRRLVPESRATEETVIHTAPCPGESVISLLMRIGVPLEELYHIFLNGTLLYTHNTMAPWLRYPQAQDDVWNWESDVPVKSGDRLGLFGQDMATLVV
ncbi:MAG: hypothetical protein JW981_01255 [Anaerolineae bacterium]|nr:hypothetical protein [Anaerolineae bacterium]